MYRASVIISDSFVILLLGILAIVIKYSGIQPYERGFYCFDASIRKPYKPSTIGSELALSLSVLVPVLYIVTVETGLYISHNLSLSRLSANTYFYLKVFLFGATVTGLLTSVGKLTIGRLRPHFISVCRPDLEFTETRCGSQENPRYITQFTCTGQDQDKIGDARLSFPSGHSSAAFYSAVFTILYLGMRTSTRSCFSLVLMNQICLLTYAWYCALTRVSDYKHHPSDVLAGGLLGLAMAAFFASFLRRRSHEAEDREEDRDIEKSRSDILLQDDGL